MYDHIQQYFVEAELAYRRERLQRGFSVHRPQHSLIERLRGARREQRNPARVASRVIPCREALTGSAHQM
jgi:hypothetical protein